MIECAFLGTLSRDAEVKVSKAGKEYLSMNMRVSDGDGAQWIWVRLFGECATDLMSKALLKGTAVYIEGSLRHDQWEGADGTKRTGLSCMSWFARPAAIGDRKPRRERTSKPKPAAQKAPANDFHNDAIGF
jgi:single-stranded DNA-binding protein